MAFAPLHDPAETAIPLKDRAATIAIVALIHLLLGYALLAGLRVTMPVRLDRSLATITLAPLPPKPPEPPEPARRDARREGAASPPNLRAKAAALVAPPPIVILPPPPPTIVAAPVAGPGAQSSAGAAPVVGPGTGSGGAGSGTGSGGAGVGDGDGGGTPLRYRSGELRDSDVPRWLPEGFDGTVGLRFTVGVKGRVTDCVVTRSSGIAALDTLTCRLIVERLRYSPERDAAGKPIPQIVTGQHQWYVGRRPPEEDGED